MKSKGFIFSITALYFVMLFMIFLGLIVYTAPKPIYRQDTSLFDKTSVKFLDGNASDTLSANGWCVKRFVYNPNIDSNTQSPRESKIYCENYGKQRFI